MDTQPTPESRPPHRDRTRWSQRPPLRMVLMLVIGAVFGAFVTITWSVSPSSRVVEGVVGAIDDSGSAMQLAEPESEADIGYGIVGVQWRELPAAGGDDGGGAARGDEDGGWQRSVSAEGYPTCLTPDDVGRRVRVGLVTDPGGVGRPSSEVVAWLECG